MKTFFSVSAALLALCFLGLEFTGRNEEKPGIVHLIWATDDNPARQEQLALFRKWYLAKLGVPIDIRIDPSNFDPTKIIIQSVAGTGPDLFDYNGPTRLQGFVESGVLLDITASARQGSFGVEHFWPIARSTIELGGRQYGVPDNVNAALILANLNLWEKRGIPLPKPGWTWKDLVALGQRLTEMDASGRIERYGLLDLDWFDLVLQNGGAVFNASRTRSIFNSPETIEALQFFDDLRSKYHIMPSLAETASMASTGGFGFGNLNLFETGHGAMISFGRFAYIGINRINGQHDGHPELRVAPLPILSQKKTAVSATARATGVNRRTHHSVEAIRFLEFLASKSFNDQINRSADCVNAVPAFAQQKEGITGGRPFQPGCDDPLWVEAIAEAQPRAYSHFINGSVLERIFADEMDRLSNHLQSAAETAQRVESRINESIAEELRNRPALKREWQALENSAGRPSSAGESAK